MTRHVGGADRGDYGQEEEVKEMGGSDGGGDYWSREICISRLNASVITVNSTTSNGRLRAKRITAVYSRRIIRVRKLIASRCARQPIK